MPTPSPATRGKNPQDAVDDVEEAGMCPGPTSDRAPSDHMGDPLAHLLDVLDLAPMPPDPANPDRPRFRGASVHQPSGRVYGGQVLAQALLAAGRTVGGGGCGGRLPHSVHAVFLRRGDTAAPIDFSVELLRDGRSFSARRTHALQYGEPILSMIASFQDRQAGVEHADAMPPTGGPRASASNLDVLGPIDDPTARFWSHQSAFELRHVGGSLYLGPDDAGPHRGAPARQGGDRQRVWVRARGRLGDGQLLHRAVLAYACDQIMLEPALRATGLSWATPGLSVASLDHAMWWHRDVRVDQWLLFVQASPSAQGGRGLGVAEVFTRDGTLVASIAQEGMLRLPR